jgi:hypothetical protein
VRGATEPPKPTEGYVEEKLRGFRSLLVTKVPICRPVTRSTFCGLYSGRKHTIYSNAASSLAVRPLNKSDSYLSTFSKCEKINFHAKPDPAPRVIQPRCPRYNVELGRYLKLMEKPICAGIAEVWGGPTVFKGMNANEQGCELRKLWDSFDDPVAIGCDATRFDQHVNQDLLRFEHSVYLQLVPPNTRPKLKSLLDMQLVNRGFARCADGVLKYEVKGRRMSGDINTGMGNCLIMCAIMHSFVESLHCRARLVNNGDDCVVVVERKHLSKVESKLSEHFISYGIEMVPEAHTDVFERIRFCQTSPVFDGLNWVMVRDPLISIDKDLCTVLPIGDCRKSVGKWTHAIGSCGMSLTGGIPVLQSFYSLLLRSGTPSKTGDHPWLDSGFKMLAHGMHRAESTVSAAARVSFWRAFGLLPDLQVEMESFWDSHTSLNFSAGEEIDIFAPILLI